MSTYRVAYRAKNGKIEFNDYQDLESLLQAHEQIGVEEDSYTMRLHGEPVLRGLIGPISEGKSIIRYETPEVFATLTEDWSKQQKGRKGTT